MAENTCVTEVIPPKGGVISPYLQLVTLGPTLVGGLRFWDDDGRVLSARETEMGGKVVNRQLGIMTLVRSKHKWSYNPSKWPKINV